MLDQLIQDEISRNVKAAVDQASWSVQECFDAMRRPSVIYRPTITQDGDMFIALLGPDLQVGVVGVGETPEKAMQAFDLAWKTPASTPPRAAGDGR